MGGFLSRLFENPLKTKPISFHLQANFKSTGEEILPEDDSAYQLNNPFDNLLKKFVAKLAQNSEDNERWSILGEFPEWNQTTIDHLRHHFIILTEEKLGVMTFRQL